MSDFYKLCMFTYFPGCPAVSIIVIVIVKPSKNLGFRVVLKFVNINEC